MLFIDAIETDLVPFAVGKRSRGLDRDHFRSDPGQRQQLLDVHQGHVLPLADFLFDFLHEVLVHLFAVVLKTNT